MNHSIIAVTGAGGFVGRTLIAHLRSRGLHARALSRAAAASPGAQPLEAIDYADGQALRRAFEGCGAVIHLAARAHVIGDRASDPDQAFRVANVDLSMKVAEAALAAGVPRLVFVSSIGAVCSETSPGHPVTETTPCLPATPYGRSKLSAEQALQARLAGASTALVVIRPPLVHGVGAPGNLQRLRRWIDAGLPLPLANFRNRRSMVHVDNLASALHACATDPRAAGRTYHVRDPRDRSTPELIRELERSCRRSARLISCPPPLLAALCGLAGKRETFAQLVGSLEIDDSRIRTELEFVPVERTAQA